MLRREVDELPKAYQIFINLTLAPFPITHDVICDRLLN